MKIQWMSGLILIMGALPMAAQTMASMPSFGVASGGAAQAGAVTSHAPAAGCPVSLKAQHKADGSMVKTGNAHPQGIGQWLHLTLADPQGKKAIEALITVHGFTDKARVTETGSGNSPDARRTLTVPFTTAAGQSAEANLWVPEMTAVQTIELDSVTFDDGAMWSFAGSTSCRITPDLFMLIAGK